MLKVCFFGIYNPEYSRNRVLMNGLRQNDVVVLECRSEKTGFKKYIDLIKKHWKIRKDYNVLFVAFPGFQTMILARFLTRKKIIFDSFAPIYESEVLDRKNIKKESLKAKYYWLLDWASFKLADIVLVFTDEYRKYFIESFNIDEKKIRKILLGTSTDLFFSQNAIEDGKFKIYFYGHLIPLQGQEYILEAACLLEKHDDIVFLMGGSVAKKKYDDGSFKNVIFKENVFKEKLAEDIQGSDVCLGIFGDTIKSKRVIPNKIYDYVACRKPVITADTPAIRELFDENDLYLVPTANSEALAKAILKLKEDSDLREKLAENSYNKFTQNCTPKILGKELLKIISF